MKTRLPLLSAFLSLLPTLLCPGLLVAERMEAKLQVIAEGLAPRMVLVTPGMVTDHGTVDVSDLFFEQTTWLGMTNGLSFVFQGTLAYEPLPNTLQVTDGVFQWSQTEGSSAPEAFSVTYAPATRTLFVIYLESLPPPTGRDIFASQLVEIVLGGEDSIGMRLTGDGGSAPAEILGLPHPGSGGLEIAFRVSGNLQDWQSMVLSQEMTTDKGGIDLTDQIFHQRKSLLFTDGSDTVFRGKLLERPQAGTLTLTDGVYHWSEASGSDSPADFSIIYAPLTGTVVTVYLNEIPESGREIAVSYDVTVANANAAFFRVDTANPVLEITGDLVFAPTGVGASSTQVIDLSNTGLGLLVIHGITFPEGFSADWTSGTIAPGESREVTLIFNPTENLEYTGTLSIESNALAGVETFEVSGEVMPVPDSMVLVAGGTLGMSMGIETVSTFEIGRYEVTWGEWKKVRDWAAANGYDIGSRGAGCADDHPVHSVSWYDILKWCNAKSEMEKLTPVYSVSGGVYKVGETNAAQNLLATGYRLPLEAEWEFAARGGNQSNGFTYAGSDDLNAVGWYADNSGGAACDLWSGRGTWPVGQKAANELGLYDMSGNVWELCWNTVGSLRRIRGGSWYDNADYAKVSGKSNNYPDRRYTGSGFRLPRSSVPNPAPEGFALIPAGSFTMGDDLDGRSNELPVHTVHVSDFYMGRMPVTKAQWDAVRSWALNKGYMDLPAGGGKGPDHPVHTVNWFDAVKWLNAWSEWEGLDPVYRVSGAVMKTGTGTPAIDYSANGYRLPTEAEWEKAARGGLSGRRFPWGDTISHDEANYRADGSRYSYDVSPYTSLTYHPDYNDGTTPYTSPVGSFAPNGYGLYDMAGNVWDWCNDYYSGTYYSSSPGVDPRGPSSGTARVNRGGSWSSGAILTRVSNRILSNPGYRWNDYGFRPARSSVP